MKKLIIIGVIVFALAGILVHDAVVEKQNRKRIETIRGWTVISREGNGLPEPLFIWGEGADHSMPTTRDEAERRVMACREKEKCRNCDAQIHHLNLIRTHKPGVGYDDNQRKRGKV